jgi:lipoate-protein ligase B
VNPEIQTFKHQADAPWTYGALEQHQDQIAGRALTGGPGALLFSELAPIITLGRRTDLARDLPQGEAGLSAPVLEVKRGGLATWHGPGQWVAFAVDRLEVLCGDPRGVRKAVQGLLEAACETALLYEPEAQIRWDAETGVWSPRGKLASVGVHIRQGVLLHGLALNVVRTPASFAGIRLCGLDAAPDFLADSAQRRGIPLDFDRVRDELEASLLSRFWPKILD